MPIRADNTVSTVHWDCHPENKQFPEQKARQMRWRQTLVISTAVTAPRRWKRTRLLQQHRVELPIEVIIDTCNLNSSSSLRRRTRKHLLQQHRVQSCRLKFPQTFFHLNSSNSSDLKKETSTTTALNKDTSIATARSTEPPTEVTNSIVEPIYSSTAPGDFWSQLLTKDPNHVETANEEEACFHFVQRIHP